MTERMTGILEAACRVIAREGADGLRMGTVAREAGVSSALIHYYFATRRDLLIAAFQHADQQVDEAATAAIEEIPLARDRLSRLLMLYAGADPVFRENWVLWVEMWRGSIFDERLREPVTDSQRSWLRQVGELIEAGGRDGSIPLVADPPLVAHRLTALVDGIGLQILTGTLEHGEAAYVIRTAVEHELSITLPEESRV
jgi:AcrR family transcriptional regulator